MIRRFFGYLSQEVRGLHAAAYVLAAAALLSSILALARDRLLAHTFGASTTLDIYYAAFRIPDLIFVATGALVSVYILIPELARRSAGEQVRYLDTIIAGFSAFAAIVALVAAFIAPYALTILYPDLARTYLTDLVALTRIMLLQPILLGLSNIFAAVTQARGRYTLYAISPLLYNAGIIAGVAVLYPLWGLPGLAWGVVLGAAMHAGIQIPSVWHDGFLRRVPYVADTQDLMRTVLISLPRALTLSMSQVTFIGLTALAGLLGPGSIAVFMFAYNLQAVPLAIIGASYSVAAFPTLAAALSNGQREHFIDQVALAARYVFFWSIPAVALIIVLRAYLVRVVLGSGNFDWTDTRLTAAVFALLAFSLAAQGITLLMVRAYYAAGRTFMPFLIACATTVTTLAVAAWAIEAFNNSFVHWVGEVLLRSQDVPGTRVLALGIGFSCASVAGAIVLIALFEHRFHGFWIRVRRAFVESILAGIAGGAAAYVMLDVLGPIDIGSTTGTVFLKGFAAGALGLIVAGLCYALLGSVEFRELMATLGSRISRAGMLMRGRQVAVASSAEDTA